MKTIQGMFGILLILLPGAILIMIADTVIAGSPFNKSLIPVSIFLSVPTTLLMFLIIKRFPFLHRYMEVILSKLLPDN